MNKASQGAVNPPPVEIPQANDVVAVMETAAPNESWVPVIPEKRPPTPYVPIHETPSARNFTRRHIIDRDSICFELPVEEK
jgi:hypothetical protein